MASKNKKTVEREKPTAKEELSPPAVMQQTVVAEEEDANIEKDLAEASNEFDKWNKEEYDKLQKQNFENMAALSEGKAGKLLQKIAVPLIVIGAIMVWNAFTSESSFEFAPVMLTVLCAVALYCYGLGALLVGVRRNGTFGQKAKPLFGGGAAIAAGALLFVFINVISNYIFLTAGVVVIVFDIIYLMGALLSYRKSNADKAPIFKIVMASFALVCGILLIVGNFIPPQIELYGQITGIVIAVFGSALMAS